jgi:plasmid stability protein
MARLKNVTVTLDEGVLRRVRVKAAEQDKSVARFVGEVLEQYLGTEEAYERAMHDYFAAPRTALKAAGTRYPRREDLYERPGPRLR